MKHFFVECACDWFTHIQRWTYHHEDGEIVIEHNLNQHNPFFMRCLIAIKYIFGYTTEESHWDVIILNEKKAKELRDFINESFGYNGKI